MLDVPAHRAREDDALDVAPDGPRSAWVIATNVYHKTPQGWRLVAHHASPGLRDEPVEEGTQASSVLH